LNYEDISFCGRWRILRLHTAGDFLVLLA